MVKLDPHSAILARLERLRVGFNTAAKLFDQSAEDHGRVSILFAFNELDDFLRVIFGIRNTSIFIPLNQLRYALHDLERGKVVPLLKPKKVKNRPRDSAAKEAFRALAAVAMDLFVKGKVPRKQAARDVAKSLSEMGYVNGPGKPITGPLVEDWRDRMITERPSQYLPAARYHRMLAGLTSRFPNDPITAARYLLASIPGVVPPDNPKKPPS